MNNSEDAEARFRAQLIQSYDMYRVQLQANMSSRDYVLSQVDTLFPDQAQSGQGNSPARQSARHIL